MNYEALKLDVIRQLLPMVGELYVYKSKVIWTVQGLLRQRSRRSSFRLDVCVEVSAPDSRIAHRKEIPIADWWGYLANGELESLRDKWEQ